MERPASAKIKTTNRRSFGEDDRDSHSMGSGFKARRVAAGIRGFQNEFPTWDPARSRAMDCKAGPGWLMTVQVASGPFLPCNNPLMEDV